MWDRKSRYEKKLNSGEVLFRENDQGEEMYLIRSGKIKLYRGEEEEEKVLAILKDGDFFGEMALIDGSPRHATAVALQETSLIIIDKESFQQKISENPLIEYIFGTLTRRLRAANEQVKYLMIRNDERRVISLLMARAKEGIEKEGGLELVENFNYDEFAQITGVDATRIKEYLRRLETSGLITIKDQRLVVRSLPLLEEYIDFLTLREKFER
jgi:CRP-like cAMP-binding protein